MRSDEDSSEPGAEAALIQMKRRRDQEMLPLDLHTLGDQILLVVPARSEMWAIVRMTGSSFAARLDFSYEDIEDIRLAITELCSSCARGASEDAECECRFDVTNSQFEMHCQVSPVADTEPTEDQHRLINTLELSRQILQATVDSYAIKDVQHGTRHGFLRKTRR